jgi:hypothetical protein
MTNLAPVPTQSATCANCSAPLAPDQRYCLSCGQPVSPVRLAFLDVLETERQPQLGAGAANVVPAAYAPYVEPAAGPAWLRRYAPLFAVASVLLLALIAGLLVGHWVTQSKAPAGPQTVKVKVEGLASAPVAAASTTPSANAPTAPASHTKSAAPASAASTKGEEQKEQAEAKAEEQAEAKAPAKAPPPKALESKAVTKLEKTTGRQHEAELNKLTTAPIEVK